ncbi:non-homologous end-joining DNA ligase [Allokutzneria oryzae]|uniref:Non-homologous end-joining DNA ligase n=1 Tax=Allokutzneria oryzae TaxID=1378989 RepID=A0ABV6A1J0_9PSEU
MSEAVSVRVDGRTVRLTNLDKVLYADGFTKGEVIDYYARIAPVLLPHLADRALTLKRFPDGVDGPSFFEKNVSRHAPDWVRTVRLATPGSGRGNEHADYAVAEDTATLVWAANLAALELHVPQWTVDPRGARRDPDLLVFDLDPGAPATIVECCRVAELLRAELAGDGLPAYPKTSGSKGLQLYVPIRGSDAERPREYARELAERLAADRPQQIVSKMRRALRDGKVLIDWSQNNTAKTTVAPYSLRAREHPTVSAPVTWDEVESCARPQDLVFTPAAVLDRVAEHGDLLADLRGEANLLPSR